MKTITYIHSGDSGDIIASLAAVKQYCGIHNIKARYILDATGGMYNGSLDPYVAKQTIGKPNKFNKYMAEFIKPLIEKQSYIDSVEICDCANHPRFDVNLNEFRRYFGDRETLPTHRQNLLYLHQVTLGLPVGYQGPWMECDTPPKDTDLVLFARSTRYQSAHVMISAILAGCERDHRQMGFVGTDLEYACFQDAFKTSPKRIPVNDALEMANVIAGAGAFVVNGTLAYWVALATGKTQIIHELGRDVDTTMFCRDDVPNLIYIEGSRFVTPKKKTVTPAQSPDK